MHDIQITMLLNNIGFDAAVVKSEVEGINIRPYYNIY